MITFSFKSLTLEGSDLSGYESSFIRGRDGKDGRDGRDGRDGEKGEKGEGKPYYTV